MAMLCNTSMLTNMAMLASDSQVRAWVGHDQGGGVT